MRAGSDVAHLANETGSVRDAVVAYADRPLFYPALLTATFVSDPETTVGLAVPTRRT